MSECEIVIDRTWQNQYYCAAHCVWFRDHSDIPVTCPVGAARDYNPPAVGVHELEEQLADANDTIEDIRTELRERAEAHEEAVELGTICRMLYIDRVWEGLEREDGE